jgi:hypothetical protein
MVVFIIAALTISAIPLKADAAQSGAKKLKAGRTYTVTLSGTAKHRIKFKNAEIGKSTDNAATRFTLYIDGSKKLTYNGGPDDEGEVSLIKVNKKTTLIFVSVLSDDDYPVVDMLYRYSGGKLIQAGDLNKLTKTTYSVTTFRSKVLKLGKGKSHKAGAYLSEWSRFPTVMSAGKNEFTVRWCSQESSTGIYYVTIPYKYSKNKVKRTGSKTYDLKLGGKIGSTNEKGYTWKDNTGTVAKAFTAYTTAGGTKKSFRAHENDKIKVLKVKLIKAKRYFKVRSEAGQIGWYQSTKGLFKEAQFAG